MEQSKHGTLFGHPTGLYTLFFAEMWERFSYYGMRALLVFYMIKGFLGYGDSQAYGVYGAYTSLVYMTPFFGGMLADRILGSRRAVILGGLLMAAGHLVMTMQNEILFFTALALLIAGNGFFKPNISTMVGSLYTAEERKKKDGGFTIFYIGINLGAALAPLLCGYIGETYGWHYGFGLATIGMLSGVAIFTAPTRLTQVLIGGGAVAVALSLIVFRPDNIYATGFNLFIAVAMLASAAIACMALQRGGLPHEVGQPRDPALLKRRTPVGLSREKSVYIGALLSVPIFALLVSGFSPFTGDGKSVRLISEAAVERLTGAESGFMQVVGVFVGEISKPAGLILTLAGLIAFVYLTLQAVRQPKISRHRMFVALTLIFFSVLFWSFFEQAGSSMNNFADRNVERVGAGRVITESEVGSTIRLQPTQAQFGYSNGAELFTIDSLTELRGGQSEPNFEIDWTVTSDNVGMNVAPRGNEIPASLFQAVNPTFILIFGLVFTALWTLMANRGLEPSTPFKFAFGLLQLALGFGAMWYGATLADERGMVAMGWLVLGYLLHTTGELCLSPVGLSMITKLSPRILVSTMMGTWFLATAFAQYLAAIISQFTGVSEGSGDGGNGIPAPIETVGIYGGVFGQICIVGLISAAICFVLAPFLTKWMHEDDPNEY